MGRRIRRGSERSKEAVLCLKLQGVKTESHLLLAIGGRAKAACRSVSRCSGRGARSHDEEERQG
jgi:hypothetical protein